METAKKEEAKRTEVGARVFVSIRHPERYARDAGHRFNGRHGVVEEFRNTHDNGKAIIPDVPRCLVRFDEPVESCWSNSGPITHFWFPVEELAAQVDFPDEDADRCNREFNIQGQRCTRRRGHSEKCSTWLREGGA